MKRNKRVFPTNEEIRQSVLQIMMAAPDKEVAASSIVSMLIDRLVGPIKAEFEKIKSEMKEDLAKGREKEKKLQEQVLRELADLKAKAHDALEAADREDEDGEEWKRGKFRTES